MNYVVLDTTVASLILNENPLLSLYYSHLLQSIWVISFQTVAEMRFGALKANWGQTRRNKLEVFFRQLIIVEYKDKLATHWAQVKLSSERVGLRLEAGDAWIAATAKMLDAPLLTHDKDFSPIACPAITIYSYGLS